MMNKIGLFLFGVLLFACAGSPHAQQTMSLDGVIVQAANDMEARLSTGAKLAVLNFTSTAEAFSDYVIEELSGTLVMNRKVTVIERKSLDLIRKEMNLQLSGDVSDDSAQAIGRQLGAQAIVTGSLTNLGDTYRFRVKVINVETARIEAQFSYNLGNNQQVAFLLSGNQQNAPPVDSVQGQAAPKPPQTTKTYKIGDTGPAGGLIFYDKGNNSGGWRYLEAAPLDIDRKLYATEEGVGVEAQRAVGTGKVNTQAIMVQANNRGGGFGWAAQACDALEVNGFDDWFLPSRDELHYMYGNLHMRNIGGFSLDWYWSSTYSRYNKEEVWMAANKHYWWSENFSDGKQETQCGNRDAVRDQLQLRIRACRQF